ncbi:MAG: carbamoyltransferase HypF [Nitrosomonas sp.]|nr:carbamoyltransferase HypF [Nitrosomonas sp.]MDP1950464.1 carbamoyltransferase HypF [Nitrosomonas sp.]
MSKHPITLDNPVATIITLPCAGPSVLACGAWLKNTVCITRENKAYISPLIGDLDSAEARQTLDHTVEHLCQVLKVQPKVVAHDLHPDFYSTQFASAYAAQHHLPLLAVQHHHAHIAAICAEHQITHAVLGLALDGVGLGTDNTPWGGELLRVDGSQFQRLGHLAPLLMPGGDRAAREPWRMAAGVLFQLNRGDEIIPRFSDQPAAATVVTMLQRGLNCPTTSSMGRLFDAAAGLLGVSRIQIHEAQAAIQLQQLAEQYGPVAALANGYRITEENELDFSPLLSELIDCSQKNNDAAYGAALFHATLATGLAEWVKMAATRHKMVQIALGGGCFHNEMLLKTLEDQLYSRQCQALSAWQMPPNDSAISLGQAWVAIQKSLASPID